jgi:excisionase family DNA binding protein
MRTGSNVAKRLSDEEETADIISLVEASKFLGVHRNTIYKMIQAEEIPAFRMTAGGPWKFRQRDLVQWLEDKQTRGRL